MSETFYPVVVEALSEDDGGGYVAYAVDLIGCMGDGETPQEAIADAIRAQGEWIAEMRRLGRPIPAPWAEMEKAQAESTRIRTMLESLMSRLRAVIDEQTAEIDRQNKEIARLLCDIHDLQVELSAIDVTDPSSRLRTGSWSLASPAEHQAAFSAVAGAGRSH